MSHNDIYSIVERLRILEEGLDKNQKSVNQLSATFKPKTVAVLTAKKDPKNPMAGKLVGGCESVDNDDEMVEDVLDKVKKSFTDFIKTVEKDIKDPDLKDKKQEDSDIKKKETKDRDLIAKTIDESPEEDEEEWYDADGRPSPHGAYDAAGHYYADREDQDAGYDAYKERDWTEESAPVKTVTMEDGRLCEIHGDEQAGFEIRHSGRCLPTRFKDLSQAELALEMFMHRRRQNDDSQDYLEEK